MSTEENRYYVGDVFAIDGTFYILANVEFGRFALISLCDSAKRYCEPVCINQAKMQEGITYETAKKLGVRPYTRIGRLGYNDASRKSDGVHLPLHPELKKREFRVAYTSPETHYITVRATTATSAIGTARERLRQASIEVIDMGEARPIEFYEEDR